MKLPGTPGLGTDDSEVPLYFGLFYLNWVWLFLIWVLCPGRYRLYIFKYTHTKKKSSTNEKLFFDQELENLIILKYMKMESPSQSCRINIPLRGCHKQLRKKPTWKAFSFNTSASLLPIPIPIPPHTQVDQMVSKEAKFIKHLLWLEMPLNWKIKTRSTLNTNSPKSITQMS